MRWRQSTIKVVRKTAQAQEGTVRDPNADDEDRIVIDEEDNLTFEEFWKKRKTEEDKKETEKKTKIAVAEQKRRAK